MKKYILKIEDQEFWKYSPSLDELLSNEDSDSSWLKHKDKIIDGQLDILTNEEIEKISKERIDKISKLKSLKTTGYDTVKELTQVVKELIELL